MYICIYFIHQVVDAVEEFSGVELTSPNQLKEDVNPNENFNPKEDVNTIADSTPLF